MNVALSVAIIINSIDNSVIKISGIDYTKAVNDELKCFGLENKYRIRTAIFQLLGGAAKNVYFYEPTPWQLYPTYRWKEVQRITTINSAKFLKIDTVPKIMATKTFTNPSKTKVDFKAAPTETAEQFIKSSWSQYDKIHVESNIHYSISIVGGTTSFNYTQRWGIKGIESKRELLDPGGSLEVTVDPHQKAEAQLNAIETTAKLQIKFESKLSGDVAIHFDPQFKGHYFYKVSVEAILGKLGRKNSCITTQTIETKVYSNISTNMKIDNITNLLI